MEKPKFTPGSWVVVLNKRTVGWVDVVGPSFSVDGPTFATDLTAADKAQRIADAHLISAAPDLYAALELFVHEYTELVNGGDAGCWDPEDEHKVIVARAALAKARGQA